MKTKETLKQKKQSEWRKQWQIFNDQELFLFKDWIHPCILDDIKGKSVLECGCGGGHHTSFLAPYAGSIVAVDLNTTEIARERCSSFRNIDFIEDDIATMDLGRKFDFVIAIGVVHHTDDPDKTFDNLRKHVTQGGRLVIWVYSEEGNALVRWIVEPMRKVFLSRLPRRLVVWLSRLLTAALYIPVHTIYRMRLPWLPYYEYFSNFRVLSFERNSLNVFDKLNAPQVEFINIDRMRKWFNEGEFKDIHISPYKGVSWRGSGICVILSPAP